ncbi:MAG: CDGSH iron-sulfur domain-containing protein [Nitrososphaerota archaeon]
MARLVRHDAKKPYVIEIGGKRMGFCACGLSNNKPYCDGRHKITADEEEGKIYIYDREGKRTVIESFY